MPTTRRKTPPLIRWLLMGSLALVLATPMRSAAQSPPASIVVFGTSLSDTGNAFALTRQASTPPDYSLDVLLVPGAPYARGGHHFSNGATWIEQFARSRGPAGSVRPAFQSANLQATNFAVGGARAYEDGVNFNLTAQVSAFLQQVGGVASSDALYVIEMGGNDTRDALVAFASGADGGAIISAALSSIAANIGALYAAGARNFLVWNVPNIGLTPAVRMLDLISPGTAQFATLLTQVFNANLATLLGQLSALPGIHIAQFDAFQLITDIVANPGGFGMTNVTEACVTPDAPPFTCQAADEFLFWDGIHPTTAAHAIIAQEVALLIAQ